MKYFSNQPLKPSIWSLNLNLTAIVYCIPYALETTISVFWEPQNEGHKFEQIIET